MISVQWDCEINYERRTYNDVAATHELQAGLEHNNVQQVDEIAKIIH